MSEFWINFLVIPRSDYLKRRENCSLLCKKVKSSIESQNVKFDEKISSGHDNKMEANDGGKVRTYKITNLSVCESEKGEKFMD